MSCYAIQPVECAMEMRDRTAYREAGHAAARIFLGLELEVVSLWRDGRPDSELRAGGGPATEWRFSDRPLGLDSFEELDSSLMALFAGSCAEDMAAGTFSPAKVPDSEAEAQALLGRVFKRGSQLSRLYAHEAWQRTHRFLKSHWPVVEALVGALRRDGQLTAEQARALANEALMQVWNADAQPKPERRYTRGNGRDSTGGAA